MKRLGEESISCFGPSCQLRPRIGRRQRYDPESGVFHLKLCGRLTRIVVTTTVEPILTVIIPSLHRHRWFYWDKKDNITEILPDVFFSITGPTSYT